MGSIEVSPNCRSTSRGAAFFSVTMNDEPDPKGHYKLVITHPNGQDSAEILLPQVRVDDAQYIGALIVAELKRLNVLPLFPWERK
jgi:hypothetical protein